MEALLKSSEANSDSISWKVYGTCVYTNKGIPGTIVWVPLWSLATDVGFQDILVLVSRQNISVVMWVGDCDITLHILV